MSHDMFGEVVHPSVTVGNRKGYTLPLSIGVHALILAVVVIVPLVATDVLPKTPTTMTFLTTIDLPSSPPEPIRAASPAGDPSQIASENPDAAPLDAPVSVAPENGAGRSNGSCACVVAIESNAGLTGGFGESIAPWVPPPSVVPKIVAGGNVKQPIRIKDVKPEYPSVARSARVQGVVIVKATIGPTGKVEEAEILRSIPLLDEAALAAVRQWEFTPTLLNGSPVSVVMTVTVNFTLQ